VADVSTQNSLWKIYDRARVASPLASREFSVGVAAMIFLRWADFEEAEREANAAAAGVEYERLLPTEFHWRSWFDSHPPELERIFQELPSALRRSANSSHDTMAIQFHRLGPVVETLSRFPTEALASLIQWVSDQPFETRHDRIAIRDILDALLMKSADRYAREFLTPVVD